VRHSHPGHHLRESQPAQADDFAISSCMGVTLVIRISMMRPVFSSTTLDMRKPLVIWEAIMKTITKTIGIRKSPGKALRVNSRPLSSTTPSC